MAAALAFNDYNLQVKKHPYRVPLRAGRAWRVAQRAESS
jgi:hypothetical protein